MMQFRVTGKNVKGKIVQFEMESRDKKHAKEIVTKFESEHGFQLETLEQKKLFIYSVSRNGGSAITGEQEAYNQDELQEALNKLGFSVKKVRPKLFNFKGRVSNDEVVTFIRLSADLLEQNLRYDEILRLISEDTTNKRMKSTIRQIEKDLRDGKDGQEVYGKHESIFGKFATYMLGIASTSGNFAQVFKSTAKFLERDAEFKKNLRKSLLMPAITLLAVIGVVMTYVGYIFPKTAGLFTKFNIDLPPMTAATLKISDMLQANWVWVVSAIAIPLILFLYMIRTPRGRIWFDKNLLAIPVIGDLLHKTSIEIFARVFYTLYSGSGENVDVIRVAAEACRNRFMEQKIKTIAIPMMLKSGRGLIESLEATGVFTKTALSRFRLGAESGSLKSNAKQLADYYEVQTNYKMDAAIAAINVTISVIIMIAMIAITVVSSETAVISPNSPI